MCLQVISWNSISKLDRILLVNFLYYNYFFYPFMLQWLEFQEYTVRKLVEMFKCEDKPVLHFLFLFLNTEV
jgi:hypothetical protein